MFQFKKIKIMIVLYDVPVTEHITYYLLLNVFPLQQTQAVV